MHKVVIANQCGCVIKNRLENNQTFNSKDDALLKAIELNKYMNESFCQKHKFEVQEIYNNFVITFFNEAKDNCCGNGCCD